MRNEHYYRGWVIKLTEIPVEGFPKWFTHPEGSKFAEKFGEASLPHFEEFAEAFEYIDREIELREAQKGGGDYEQRG